MANKERKYNILPGIPTPDMDEILWASSDYSDPGVSDVDVYTRGVDVKSPSVSRAVAPESAELNELQRLGEKVAEEEEKAKLESQRVMDSIKNRAVIGPASLDALKNTSERSVSPERKAQIDAEMKVREEEESKKREIEQARADRRSMQRRAVEELKQKTVTTSANEADALIEEFENADKVTETVEETKAPEKVEPIKEVVNKPINEPVKESVIEPVKEEPKILETPVIPADEFKEEAVEDIKDDFEDEIFSPEVNIKEELKEEPVEESNKDEDTADYGLMSDEEFFRMQEEALNSSLSIEERNLNPFAFTTPEDEPIDLGDNAISSDDDTLDSFSEFL